MKLFGKDLDKDLIVVAEIGVNHEGNVHKARDLMLRAFDSGADAVKFQLGNVTTGPKRTGHRFQIFQDDLLWLKAQAGDRHVFSSALDLHSVQFCGRYFEAIKIASRDNKNRKLIKAAAKTGKPVILSTGNMTCSSFVRSMFWLWTASGTRNHVALHCTSSYPTPTEEANVRAITSMKWIARYVGYSNHVQNPLPALASVVLGACMVEVHFTDDRSREFRDHKLSFDEDTLKTFIHLSRNIRQCLGDGIKKPQPSEKK